VFTLLVAAAVTAEVSFELIPTDGVVAGICAFVFVMVVNAAAPVVCWTAMSFAGVQIVDPEVDAFTGLSTPEAFRHRIGELTGARGRDEDKYLVVTTVILDDLPLFAATAPCSALDRAQVAVAQTLSQITRGSAVLSHITDDTFVVAETFKAGDMSGYVDRIVGALANTPPRMNLSIGIARTPMTELATCPPQNILDELIGVARTAARNAVPEAGLRTRMAVVTVPRTSAVDDCINGDGLGDF
jgi:GGDEF domain-containing protein